MYSIKTLTDGDFLYRDNHRIDYMPSPNRSGKFAGGALRFLVMHYTAGSSAASSANWFTRPEAKASAHLTIGRDGEIKQSVPLDLRAWHAGSSSWTAGNGDRFDGLNSYSIGIELANAGACVRTEGGDWVNPLGVRVAAANIVTARHRNGPVWFQNIGNVAEPGWEIYPQAQMQAAIAVAILLVNAYGLEDILGHDDIAPSRKRDPGPLFDMTSFKGAVMGREDERPDHWQVRADTPGGLAIRTEPTKTAAKVRDENLAPGTSVAFNEAEGNWWFVTVLAADGTAELDGWVYSKYLTPA